MGLIGEEVARPELPARSQPDRPDRARRRTARGRDRRRDRPRPRRPDARAARRGRGPRHRGRADRRCLPALAEIAAHYPGRLTVIDGDALRCGLARAPASRGEPARIVANLPYNGRHAAADRLAEDRALAALVGSLTLMFQREVAERIVAPPEQRADYGRLAVLSRTGAARRASCSTCRRPPSCRRRR